MSYECWAWLVKEESGVEGVIAAYIPTKTELGPMVLQSRKREVALKMARIAHAHSPNVRLAHLKEVENEST